MILGLDGERVAEMMRFFLLALAVVAPLTWVSIRRTQRRERAMAPTTDAPAEVGPDVIGDVVDPDELSLTITAIDTAAPTPDAPIEIDVSLHPLIDGHPAPDALVSSLIDDAVRRNGLAWEWVPSSSNGTPPTRRAIRVTRRPT